MSELQQPRFECVACGLDKGPGRTLCRLCLMCHHKTMEANRNTAIEMDLANANATIARIEGDLAKVCNEVETMGRECERLEAENAGLREECRKARAILGPFGMLRTGIIQEDGLMYEDARREVDAAGWLKEAP